MPWSLTPVFFWLPNLEITFPGEEAEREGKWEIEGFDRSHWFRLVRRESKEIRGGSWGRTRLRKQKCKSFWIICVCARVRYFLSLPRFCLIFGSGCCWNCFLFGFFEKKNQINTVRVSNVSPRATEHDIQDFFSFSGEIEHVELHKWVCFLLPSLLFAWCAWCV
jgi:hypothetical protein